MGKIITALLAAVFLFISIGSNVWAEEEAKSDLEQNCQDRAYRFSRGATNVVTGPLEVPTQIIKRAHDGDGMFGQLAGYGTGFFTGVGWCGYRIASGLYDVFSSPFTRSQESLVKPEYVSDYKVFDDLNKKN